MTSSHVAHAPERKHFEIIDGQWIEKPVSLEKGRTVLRILSHLGGLADGIVVTSLCGFEIFQHLPHDPRRLRRPDGAYFACDRIPPPDDRRGDCHTVPTLAVLVVTEELANDLEEAVLDYLGAGVLAVWVFFPRWKRVRVYDHDGSVSALSQDDYLSQEAVIPGFHVRVADCFPGVLV